MGITRHICVDIAGLEKRMQGEINDDRIYKPWEIFEVDGRPATFNEVKSLIEEHKKLGHDVIAACDYIDEKGHCKGHEEPKLQTIKKGI